VLFAGKSGGLVYYAMPRVRGESLRHRIDRGGPLPCAEALRIFSEVAHGLHHAHGQGIVHRDVKPANILLDETGRVRLVDFGVAKALAVKGVTVSLTGELIGTPEYMSPEQARGTATIDHRCDIYSLGVVGFEMLSGRVPFTGDTIHAVLQLHIDAAAPHVAPLRPDAPPALGAAIATCLEKDPARRWQTAEAAARAAGN
jgi:serine/threonine protein kinase